MKRFELILGKYLNLWKRLTGWKKFFFFLFHYSVIFWIFQRLIFSAFYTAGKSFILTVDASREYFPRMIYVSQTIRDGIQSLLAGEGWNFPLYDFRLGPTQANLQMEPLQWLAIFCPWDRVDVLYDYLVLIRFYLVGVSFSLMGFYFGQRALPVMIGALSYTFCGFALYGGTRHPFFLAPMIMLPLLAIGAEKILKGEKSWLFVGSVFLSATFSLYFSCMLAFVIVVYFFARYFCTNWGKRDILRGCWSMVGRMVLWGGVGLLLSSFSWLPTFFQMLGTSRIGRDTGQLLYYSKDIYEKFLTNFIVSPVNFDPWSNFGFSVFAIPAALLLYLDNSRKNADKSLKVLFFIYTAMVCSPAVAYMLSGFNAITGRWYFTYALCVSAIIMFKLPALLTAEKSTLMAVGGGVIAYIAICYFLIERKYYNEEPLILLIVAMISLVLCYGAGKAGKNKILPMCLVLTCLSTYYSAFLLFAPAQRNVVAGFESKGTLYSALESGQYTSLGKSTVVTKDEDLFWVTGNRVNNKEGAASFYNGLNGLSFYSSNIYPSYRALRDELEVGQRVSINQSYGVDSRVHLMTLLGVKYYALREEAKVIWPFGMKKIDQIQNGKKTDIILENEYALPAGYTYDSYIDEAALDGLSGVEKQEIMLQSIALAESGEKHNIPSKKIETRAEKILTKIELAEGASWENGKLSISKENTPIVLRFEGLPRTDTYLRIVNLDLTNGQSTRGWFLTVETEKTLTGTRFAAAGDVYSPLANTQILYLGYSANGYTSCTLTFPEKGTFILDDLEIWCQPMDHYAEQIEALRAESLDNVETNWRGLTGTISVSKDKFLCFSIPYDKGWTVYVDGKKAKLVQANIGFMGVELPTGDHDIELKYWPPGLTMGIVLSGIGLVGVIGLAISTRKTKRKGMAEK